MKKHDGRAVLQEMVKRFGDDTLIGDTLPAPISNRTYRWRADLFDKQLDLVDDPSRFKAALCSRRAGKTYTVCFYMLEMASRNPESLIAYIALTRTSAKRLMWNQLKRANRKYQIGMKFNNTELVCTLPNHSQIFLTGANDEADIDKLRGPAYHMVCIDEAQSYGRFLEELIEEVIEPALVDYNGVLMLTGTPNAACAGYFYDATTKPEYGFKIHEWTIRENPYIPHASDYLATKCKQKAWDENNPIYLREWCGKWVKSQDSLVYKYQDKIFFDQLPESDNYHYLLGIDLGYATATSFSIGAYSEDYPELYVFDTPVHTKLVPSEICEITAALNDMYGFESIVADTGGLGRSIVEEMRQRWMLPIKAAEKKNKAAYIELFNDDLRNLKIRVKRDAPVLDEWRLLQWDENKHIEDKRFANHASDATLYMWREARHFLWNESVRDPVPGEPGYWEHVEQTYIDDISRRVLGEEEEAWWIRGYQLN